jgi:hypothetical protein
VRHVAGPDVAREDFFAGDFRGTVDRYFRRPSFQTGCVSSESSNSAAKARVPNGAM